jgi:hypothetical protein
MLGHRLLMALSVLCIVAVILIGLFLSRTGSIQARPDNAPAQAYFTTDDGATYFADDAKKTAPFDHNGKEAVQCFVFTSDGGKTRFVGYLQRFSVEGKKRREAMSREQAQNESARILQLMTEVKKPGQANWIRGNDPAAAAITTPIAPDGSDKTVSPIDPE